MNLPTMLKGEEEIPFHRHVKSPRIRGFPHFWKCKKKKKKIGNLNRKFESVNRIWHVTWYMLLAKSSLQYAPFEAKKCKSSVPWEGGHPLPPHPPPSRSLRSLAIFLSFFKTPLTCLIPCCFLLSWTQGKCNVHSGNSGRGGGGGGRRMGHLHTSVLPIRVHQPLKWRIAWMLHLHP